MWKFYPANCVATSWVKNLWKQLLAGNYKALLINSPVHPELFNIPWQRPFGEILTSLRITFSVLQKELMIKRNELLSHEKTWRNPECILLSAGSQSERLHAIWFQPNSIREKAKLWWQSHGGDCQGSMGRRRRDEQVEHGAFAGQWSYFAWYSNGYTMLCISQVP